MSRRVTRARVAKASNPVEKTPPGDARIVLNHAQTLAVGLLARGTRPIDTANAVSVGVKALWTWRQLPVFQEALARAIADRQAALDGLAQMARGDGKPNVARLKACLVILGIDERAGQQKGGALSEVDEILKQIRRRR